ncbi:MAG: magnesium transporter CorA [Candidatus Verstraetearchaeota archaeon]|nr:magnesium transporter CorA [Candidatus Verstraetearchaeota archaeon]
MAGATRNNSSVNHRNNGLVLEAKGYCAALQNGETRHRESHDIGDFCQLVSDASIAWIDYITEDLENEAPRVATTLGFSDVLIKHLLKDLRSGYEDFGNEMGILLPAILVKGFDVKLAPLIILLRENVIVTIHHTEVKRFSRIRRYAETLMRRFPPEMSRRDRITMMLTRIIDENNARNFDHLQEIEAHGDKMSEELADPKTPRNILGPKIHQMKHALIVYLGGLWATVDALNSLLYGDADLISDDARLLNKLTGLVGEVHSQIGLAEHMSEVLASGLEALQAIYNNQLQILNNRLAFTVAYLTIIGTALLVPNTIATIVSSGMFGFTQLDIIWYLPLLIISTVLATFSAWFAVKRMGFIPKGPE